MPANGRRAGGIVLAGGRSSRMGRSKAWLPVAGTTLLQRTVATVVEGLGAAAGRSMNDAAPACPVVVVAAAGQKLPPLGPDVVVARDRVAAQGPLQGMEAGLAGLENRADVAFVSSCDAPLLRPAFVARMVALLDDDDIAVPRAGDRFHPLAGVYRVALLPLIRELLAAEKRRPFFLFERARTHVVEEDELAAIDPGLESLQNVNTPEEYREILRRLDDEKAPPATGADVETDADNMTGDTDDGAAAARVVFELFGIARLRGGRDELPVTAATLGRALAALEQACPDLATTLVEGGRLTEHALLSINGRGFVSDPAVRLRDGDRLILMSAAAGG